MPDPVFDADAVCRTTFVRHIEVHDTLTSTNDRAAELARAIGVSLPALVIARDQTAGRGRGINQWWSTDGALTFSLLLDPVELGIPSHKWPLVSLATAVAVCEALSAKLESSNELSSQLQVKWPNDVLLNGRKVCGILIEAPAAPAAAKRCLVIGIGVNVNNSTAGAPTELRSRSIALCEASNRRHSLQEVLIRILTAIEQQLRMLEVSTATLHAEVTRLCFLSGKQVCIESRGRQVEGVCAGIGEDGALILETTAGRTEFFSGSVRKWSTEDCAEDELKARSASRRGQRD